MRPSNLRSRARVVVVTGIIALIGSSAVSNAAAIVQWNFNSVPPDASNSTGTTTPTTDLVVGTPTIGTTGGVTQFYTNARTSSNTSFPLDNSSDPATSDNTGYAIQNTPAQGTGNKTGGVVFQFNASGYKDISLTWDQRTARFASRYWQVQYSTDGTTFTDAGSLFAPAAVDRYQAVAGGGSTLVGVSYNQFNNGITRSFGSALDEATTAYIRIVAAFDPSAGTSYLGNPGNDGLASNYNSANTVNFDTVTIGATAVPEPASLGLLAVGAMCVLRRRR